MKNTIIASLVLCTSVAFAQGAPQKQAQQQEQAQMDMSQMGPAARKPTNEKASKKEINAFFKKLTTAERDLQMQLSMIDFPVYMVTDDMKGNIEAKEVSREEYEAMMKPMSEQMPKDLKVTHKPTITVLSDNLAAVTDHFTMTMGKQKIQGHNGGLLVKKNGNWMWKSMVEAGWGGMSNVGGAGTSGQMKGSSGTRK